MDELQEIHMRRTYGCVVAMLQEWATEFDEEDRRCIAMTKSLSAAIRSEETAFWANDVPWCLAGMMRAYKTPERVTRTLEHLCLDEENTKTFGDLASNPMLPRLTRCAYLILAFRTPEIRQLIRNSILTISD